MYAPLVNMLARRAVMHDIIVDRKLDKTGSERSKGATSGVLMTVSESLFHLASLQRSSKPHPATAFRVPSANLRTQGTQCM